MILPTKYIRLQNSLLNSGAILLNNITNRQSVTQLWERTMMLPEIKTFDKFTLALDMLFSLGLIDIRDGIIVRLPHD